MKREPCASDKLKIERELLSQGFETIAGVDEVGRGPLAGPVVCAAVVMPLKEIEIIQGVDDSKKLSPKKRELLAKLIRERALAYTVYEVNEKIIDEINILQATRLGMKNALESLKIGSRYGHHRREYDVGYSVPAKEYRARRRAFLFDRCGEHRRKSIQGRTHGRICKDVSRIRF